MKQDFGKLADGRQAFLYTIKWHNMTARITDFGATLVSLWVPDKQGNLEDVVLGYDTAGEYQRNSGSFGATVGRNANRIAGAQFSLNGKTYQLAKNNGENNLHSGPDGYGKRLWQVCGHRENAVSFLLHSPDGDQGFPGNADIRVTYSLEAPGALHIVYDALCDRDTVFNLTNHAYFNLAGHKHTERSMEQLLTLPARIYTPSDSASIPLGICQPVEGTPFDFRTPKAVGRDVNMDHPDLIKQQGYDHNFEVFTNPCAILQDTPSGRVMAVYTDAPGLQLYSGNFLRGMPGKDGALYPHRAGVALETQYYPNSVNEPSWQQPFVKAGTPYRSETVYSFKSL